MSTAVIPGVAQGAPIRPETAETLRTLITSLESILAASPPPPSLDRKTVLDVGNEFLVSRARKGASVRYLRHLRSTLTLTFEGWMLRPVHTITAEEIERSLCRSNIAPRTVRGRLTVAQTFFAFAIRRGYSPANPASAIDAPALTDGPPGILKPHQVAHVLATAAAMDPGAVRVLALMFFAGLRTSEALSFEERNLLPRHVEVTAAKAKTRRRRLVTRTETLDAWLGDPEEPLPLLNAAKRIRRVRAASGIDFPHNAARHSFCSYHLAHFGSAARTAMEAGHSEQMLFQHYREVVTPEAAAAFWSLRPGQAAAPASPASL